jgi:hypothetical protein
VGVERIIKKGRKKERKRRGGEREKKEEGKGERKRSEKERKITGSETRVLTARLSPC